MGETPQKQECQAGSEYLQYVNVKFQFLMFYKLATFSKNSFCFAMWSIVYRLMREKKQFNHFQKKTCNVTKCGKSQGSEYFESTMLKRTS